MEASGEEYHDFDGFRSFLTQFRSNLGLVLDSFRLRFLHPFGVSFWVKTQGKPMVFHYFGAPKRLSFGLPFGIHFGFILDSVWDPFGAPFGPGPNLHFRLASLVDPWFWRSQIFTIIKFSIQLLLPRRVRKFSSWDSLISSFSKFSIQLFSIQQLQSPPARSKIKVY